MAKKISKAGIDLIKEFEGCYLKAYKDPVGVWTIGYGITNSDKSITGTTIKSGLSITKNTAEQWLEKSLNKKYVPLVLKYDDKYDWTQGELDALTSFAYNIGSIDQLTARGTRSKKQIANKLLEYNKAGGRVFKGLTRRRKAEKALFESDYDAPAKDTKEETSKSTNNKTLKVTAKSGLNVRSGAGTSNSKVTSIQYKKTVTWLNGKKKTVDGNDWYYISFNGTKGWALAKWLKVV